MKSGFDRALGDAEHRRDLAVGQLGNLLEQEQLALRFGQCVHRSADAVGLGVLGLGRRGPARHRLQRPALARVLAVRHSAAVAGHSEQPGREASALGVEGPIAQYGHEDLLEHVLGLAPIGDEPPDVGEQAHLVPGVEDVERLHVPVANGARERLVAGRSPSHHLLYAAGHRTVRWDRRFSRPVGDTALDGGILGAMFRRHLGTGLTLALMASLAPGCGRGRDCTKLADVANRRSAEISQIEARQSETPDTLATDMKALADVAEHVVEEVESLEIDDEALEDQARRYGETAHDLAEASQSYASLMETLTDERDAQRRAESAFQKSGQGLLDACSTASAACNAVGDVLRAQPESPDASKLPELLATYVEGLEALELEEGPVANAVAIRIAATKAYKAVVTRRASLDDDIDAARGRIHNAVDKQNALIEQLNVFCVGKE